MSYDIVSFDLDGTLVDTAAEIAEAAGLERHVPSRRLPELRQAGQVKNGEERVCAITGNPSMTWFPCVENN